MAQDNKKDKKQQVLSQLKALTDTEGEDIMGKIVKLGLEQLMELERDTHVGKESYERGEGRRTYRNGYKDRQLYTRVGPLTLRVPKTRDGKFYPSILNKYQRSEKALVLALAEAYYQGVSTRKMKRVTERLLGKEFSSQAISDFAARLDGELEGWRNRSIEGHYPYVLVDARYEKCRIDHRIADVAVLIAIGINEEGYREVLSVDVRWGETKTSWEQFFGDLKERGLSEVRLFTSDAHPGIRSAIKHHFTGTAWQRCQCHFLREMLDSVPKSRRAKLHDLLKIVWESHDRETAKKRLKEAAQFVEDCAPGTARRIVEDGWQTLTVYDVAPPGHHRRLRTTNMVERVNEELKRRSKVVRIFPNPESCLRLFSALLKELHEDWCSGRKYLDMDKLKEWKREQKKPDKTKNSTIKAVAD
jgi:transposase-like protein